jgi:hypothetical protein
MLSLRGYKWNLRSGYQQMLDARAYNQTRSFGAVPGPTACLLPPDARLAMFSIGTAEKALNVEEE